MQFGTVVGVAQVHEGRMAGSVPNLFRFECAGGYVGDANF